MAPLPRRAVPDRAVLASHSTRRQYCYVDDTIAASGVGVLVGAALSLPAGSGAKGLLAWSDPREPLPAGVDAAEVAAVRRRGWASSVGEREPGVASVSAPVLDGSDRAVAAVSVSGPIERLGRRPGVRFAAAVVAAARDLERRAGLAGPVENP